MARCLVGCGSNLGKRRDQLDHAIDLLRFMPGITLEAVSRFRETRPVGGPPGQRSYLNGACAIETDLAPHDVLGLLAAVENTLHRDRRDRWGERTVDLDLLLYDDVVLDSRELTLPHPRMTTRRFVLEPCAEIAAEWWFPPAACTIRDLLDNISVAHPLIAVVGVPGSGVAEIAAAVADATMARLVHGPLPESATSSGDGHLATITTGWSMADWSMGGREAGGSPHVAILLLADAATLEERIAFRCRGSAPPTDVFADITAAGSAVCDAPAATVEHLLRFQDRIARRLRCPGERDSAAPKAVVAIDAADLAQAAAEATAAVEAML
jgi:2-amino-4-hydroxy-6-hydroxymethyldihydropteridine diphosphokinase